MTKKCKQLENAEYIQAKKINMHIKQTKKKNVQRRNSNPPTLPLNLSSCPSQIALGLVHIYGYELIKILSTGKQECSHTIAVFIKAND